MDQLVVSLLMVMISLEGVVGVGHEVVTVSDVFDVCGGGELGCMTDDAHVSGKSAGGVVGGVLGAVVCCR